MLFGNMLIILSTKSKVFGMNSVSGFIFHQIIGQAWTATQRLVMLINA